MYLVRPWFISAFRYLFLSFGISSVRYFVHSLCHSCVPYVSRGVVMPLCVRSVFMSLVRSLCM